MAAFREHCSKIETNQANYLGEVRRGSIPCRLSKICQCPFAVADALNDQSPGAEPARYTYVNLEGRFVERMESATPCSS